MAIIVERTDPQSPAAQELLQAGHAAMQALFPAKRQVAFSIAPPLANNVHLFTARADGRAVGCCALFLNRDFAELKKLYVAPEARRQGVADRLIAYAEAVAVDAGFAQLKLETGVTLTASHRLYARRGAFGDHVGSVAQIR